jgi:UDP-N-acetyl-2-amino-2-deoxyglucuronate dehydrogenase
MSIIDADSLRYVVIGVGASIFPTHRRAQVAEDTNVVAVCDQRVERGKQRAAEIGCAFYEDYHVMLAETKPDAAIIVTEHPAHPAIAIDCLRAGCHVLVEKPMAADVAAADAMIAEADKSGRILAVNLQHRFRPAVEKARQLVADGAIGPLVRTLSIEPWYRTAYYYRLDAWRASWTGGGGGVLLNQAPHTLDTLCHLAGMPRKVWGWVRTLYHSVDSEDTAQAMFEYPNGAPGYLTASTVEYGVQPRLQIAGEKGTIELAGNQLTIHRSIPSTREYMFSSTEMFGHPETHSETLDIPDSSGGHQAVYRDFAAAIREGRQPRSNGREGLMSLELANAITLSSYDDRAVTLPLGRAAYGALLADLQAARRPINPDGTRPAGN